MVHRQTSDPSDNIITLEQDHLNQVGSCVDVTGRLDDLLEDNQNESRELQVLLDFQWIEKITSIGLNELIRINSEAKRRDIQIVLGNVTQTVRDILALTRLERLFVFESARASA
ncbi:MAG: STAS domain-containing protein [Rubripirellula sp.]|nr:STAS domain-containing protein [Rubripirellula sp.]